MVQVRLQLSGKEVATATLLCVWTQATSTRSLGSSHCNADNKHPPIQACGISTTIVNVIQLTNPINRRYHHHHYYDRGSVALSIM